MREQNVVVIGGTGFIGCHLLNRLAQDGFNTVVPVRHDERAKHLTTLPYLDLDVADVHDDATLRRLLQGRDAVINLVGVLHGGCSRCRTGPHACRRPCSSCFRARRSSAVITSTR